MVDTSTPPDVPIAPAMNTFHGTPQYLSAFGPIPMSDGNWTISLNQMVNGPQLPRSHSPDRGPHSYANTLHKVHNGSMETPTSRAELDAKLETIEARMDGRLARIEDAVKRISEDNAATRASISSLKTTTIVTAVGAVLTVLFGVAAFNATLLSNMTSSFDSGRETAKLAAEAQVKTAQTQEQTARLIAEAEVKAAQAQKDTATALAEIRAIVSDLNKKPQ